MNEESEIEKSRKLFRSKEEVRELLQKYNHRELFRILAGRVLLPDQPIPNDLPRNIETKPSKIIISEQDLLRLRAGYSGPVTQLVES